MKQTKTKILSVLLLLTIAASLLSLFACGGDKLYSEGSGELRITATTFAPFDFARAVAGEKATVTILQDNGADLHNYSPTTATLTALSESDIFICVGGESDDKWINDALEAANNPELKVIKLSELTEESFAELEGHNHSGYCEANHPHNEEDHDHEEGDGHVHSSDEHVWNSLKNAEKFIEAIKTACTEKDPDNAGFYTSNADAYIAELKNLDAQYTEAVGASEKKTLVFADRFPFIYLTSDYGLCYYAAFSGCSAEVDASFETQAKLTEAVKDNGLSYVIVIEGSDANLAESIKTETGCEILTLNSMQSVRREQIKEGMTYLSVMKSNLEVLKKAL